MKKTSLLSLCLFLTLSLNLVSQTTIPNVLNFKSKKQSGEIIENNKIVGYFVFYFKEKTDKNNSAYEIELFDDNYNSVKSFEIVRPKKTLLFEMVYNGEVFLFFFYDKKTGYEYVTYDRDGKQIGSTTIAEDDIPTFDLQRSMTSLSTGTENITFFPMGKEGFIRQSFTKNKKLGYEIIAYDNNMKTLWSYASDEASKFVEGADIGEVTTDVITATISRKKNQMTREMDLGFLILDAKTGEKITEVAMGTDDTGKRSILKTFVEKETSKITLVGEFYAPKDDILKDLSKGLFIQGINFKGDELNYTEYTWKGDISTFKQENLDEEDKKEAGKSFVLFFHDAIRSKDGHLFLVGEQFRKQVSAGAIAGKLVAGALGGSSNASNFEIRVGNMVVMEFDQTNKLVDFDVVNKKKTTVYLQEGMGWYGSAFLGYYINSIGGFDYSFTSRDVANDKFSVVYVDANRREESKSDKSDIMLGVINVEKGKKTTSRLAINSDARSYWIQPAKPGYISIGEYYRKEKKLTFRLEQLAY